MSLPVLPTIGASGFYELASPLTNLISPNERYTCQAIRRIADYLANNEDVKALVYDENGLPETEYNDDSEANMYIVSLQSAKGHWLYIPARYIVKYPIVNGIPYRTIMIGASLPPIPSTLDLSNLLLSIENTIKDSLGVIPVVKTVETSRVVLVDSDKHIAEQANRNNLITNNQSDKAKYNKVLQQLNDAIVKIAALEQYIEDNL